MSRLQSINIIRRLFRVKLSLVKHNCSINYIFILVTKRSKSYLY